MVMRGRFFLVVVRIREQLGFLLSRQLVVFALTERKRRRF